MTMRFIWMLSSRQRDKIQWPNRDEGIPNSFYCLHTRGPRFRRYGQHFCDYPGINPLGKLGMMFWLAKCHASMTSSATKRSKNIHQICAFAEERNHLHDTNEGTLVDKKNHGLVTLATVVSALAIARALFMGKQTSLRQYRLTNLFRATWSIE